MKYFLLSIFSSALLLFGFSYLYGTAGTTNLTAVGQALMRPGLDAGAAGLALTAVVLVTAGLGFRITAVPFHFYAPDVYEGTTPSAAAILSFVPKVAGFAVLLRIFGYNFGLPGDAMIPGRILDGQGLKLLWILAAVTMTLGNVLALLQNNLRRLLAYSSVAHAGYILAGLAAGARCWRPSRRWGRAAVGRPGAGAVGRRRGGAVLPRRLRGDDHRRLRAIVVSG